MRLSGFPLPLIKPAQIRDEQHFLALAAEAMRQILVDHARAKTADKRGGVRPVSMSTELNVAITLRADPGDVLALSEALTALEAEDPEAATTVKMRNVVGVDTEEIAALLGVTKRAIERRYRFAMADLRTRSVCAAACPLIRARARDRIRS